MFAILLLLPLALLGLLAPDRHGGRRGAALMAAVAWGSLLVLITEALTLFRALNLVWLSAAWGAVSLALLLACVLGAGGVREAARRAGARVRASARGPLPPASVLLPLAGVGLVVGAAGLNALAAAPLSYDAMTYHLARVAHWEQNGGVGHYPTHVLRQLYLTPWAEWAVLHAQVLSGGDRLANLVQWGALVGSLPAVSLIAEQLGGGRRARWLSVVVAATIPCGILEASGALNDFVLAFWLACFAHFVLALRAGAGPAHALAAGASLGLALLTKGTAYVYAAPLAAWLAFGLFRGRGRRAWAPLLAAGAAALLLNAGYYARNVALFGSPLGVDRGGRVEGYKFTNDVVSAPALVSNVARNLALHASTPSERLNHYAEAAVYRVHRWMGLDVNDPRTTWSWLDAPHFRVRPLNTSEYLTGNALHLALVLFSAAALCRRGRRAPPEALAYAAALAAGFLLFCAYLKWQPWHARQHLSLFVLWSPPVALALTSTRSRLPAGLAAAALLACAAPYVLFNKSRPLVASERWETRASVLAGERVAQYFPYDSGRRAGYKVAAEFLSARDCARVGLLLGPDDFEYPLWAYVRALGRPEVRFQHVGVENASALKYAEPPFDAFEPCALFARGAGLPAELLAGGRAYRHAFDAGADVHVYLR